MRKILALGLLLMAGCFEEANPVDETGAMQSSGEEFVAGTEGCPCIEGECVSGLECFSNVCVDAGGTSMATEGLDTTSSVTSTTEPSTTVSTMPMTSSMTTDEPLDEGPVTTDVGGDLPAGSPCDPFVDLCAPDLVCNGVDVAGLSCVTPGVGEQDYPCEMSTCSPGYLCTYGLSSCMTRQCCAALCDLNGMGECDPGLMCRPFYPMGMAPMGYEHVGVCEA